MESSCKVLLHFCFCLWFCNNLVVFSVEALRVQFVRDGGKTVVAVLTKTGMVHLFDAPEIVEDSSEAKGAAAAEVATLASSGRFDGLLGPSAVAKQPQQNSQITGRNNVPFPASFLPDTASHVLPSATVMLSVLLEELTLKKQVKDPHRQVEPDEELPNVLMMELDSDEPDTSEVKLPHHFSAQARGRLVEFFKSKQK
jgi:hypothetical protein